MSSRSTYSIGSIIKSLLGALLKFAVLLVALACKIVGTVLQKISESIQKKVIDHGHK